MKILFSSLPHGILQILLCKWQTELILVAPLLGGDLGVTVWLLAWYLLGWARVPVICNSHLGGMQDSSCCSSSADSLRSFSTQPLQFRTTSELSPWLAVQSWNLCTLHHTGLQMPGIRKSLGCPLCLPSPSLAPRSSCSDSGQLERETLMWPPRHLHWWVGVCRFLSWEHCLLRVCPASLKPKS